MERARYSCRILMKLEFSRKIFEKKYLDTKFRGNSSVGAEMFHTETNRQT
jgi:hypothetical protein